MPKEKFLITSDCRLGPNHTIGNSQTLSKGQVIEIDLKNKRDAEVLDLLNLAARVARWTPANEEFIRNEIKRESAELERLARERAKSASAEENLVRRLVKILSPQPA